LILLFFCLYAVGKVLIQEIRETAALPALPADIFFADEKYAAEENTVFVSDFVILCSLCEHTCRTSMGKLLACLRGAKPSFFCMITFLFVEHCCTV
jgi:hypothetical protein